MQQSAEVEHGSPIWPLAHWGFWGRALAYTVTVPAAKIVSIARKMVLLCIEKMSNGGVDSGSTRWDDYGQALILFLYRQGIAKIGLVLDSVFKLCHPKHSSCLSTWAVQQDIHWRWQLECTVQWICNLKFKLCCLSSMLRIQLEVAAPGFCDVPTQSSSNVPSMKVWRLGWFGLTRRKIQFAIV